MSSQNERERIFILMYLISLVIVGGGRYFHVVQIITCRYN